MNRFYNTYSSYLLKRIGERTYKIPLNINSTCPNRDGSKSASGCSFCSERGSGTGSAEPLLKQIDDYLTRRKKHSYIGYLQSFSNMYGDTDELIGYYRTILEHPLLAGISVATRPDTVSSELIEFLSHYRHKFIQVELGLESANQRTLDGINRHDSPESFSNAVRMIKEISGGSIHSVGHMIIGLPGDRTEDSISTAVFIADSGAEGIKIHNLYIERDMALYEDFSKGILELQSEGDYIDTVLSILENISKDIVIHRLKSTSMPSELIAPLWTLDAHFHMKVGIEAEKRKTFQGKSFGNNHYNCW